MDVDLSTDIAAFPPRCGYRIYEQPDARTDDPNTRVRLLRKILDDLKGILRLRRVIRRRTILHAHPQPIA